MYRFSDPKITEMQGFRPSHRTMVLWECWKLPGCRVGVGEMEKVRGALVVLRNLGSGLLYHSSLHAHTGTG